MLRLLKNYHKSHKNPVNQALHRVGIPLILISIIMAAVMGLRQDWKYWPWAVGLFVFGWILQIAGHFFEGKPPAFFSNPIYLLIGPIWWIKKIFKGKK